MISTNKLFYSTYCLLLAKYTVCNKPTEFSTTTSEESCVATTSQKNMNVDDFKYESGTSSVAFVTAPDDKIAKKLAKGLVEQKLAACVNIIPNIQSVYMWEGQLNEDNEYLMMIKTRTSRLEELTKWVRDNHPYSVAEVITLPIEYGNFPYMKWLSESVPNK